jgi:hypothetical protein
MRTLLHTTLLAAIAAPMLAQTPPPHPRDTEIHSADTLAWWHTTEALSGDSMEGRDTGTAAYQRAADYVAARFRAAGLKPAGDNGTYFQVVPMHEIDVLPEGTFFTVVIGDSDELGFGLKFLHDITLNISAATPREVLGAIVFRGYCGKHEMSNVKDRVVLCFGTQHLGLPSSGERTANASAAGAVGIINIDDPYFSIEPPRWPAAYARSVTLKTAQNGAPAANPILTMRCSAEAFHKFLQGTKHDPDFILKTGGGQQPLANFDLLDHVIHVKLATAEKDISSPNVLALLPGSDDTVGNEVVVAGAHLDGYGYGTPVKGDALYNGALDDAAYVALLIQMADDLRAGLVKKGGLKQVAYMRARDSDARDTGITLEAPRRSILFAAFTGEEKGLLGSSWFVQHPTVPKEKLVADVNLDQLRPLFPLKIMTAEAVNDTTLGATAREVGAKMGIDIREDKEPERGLLRRADQYPFLKIGVPAISFIFGYDDGTDEERRYREWYQVRYHRPQDDLTQPVDFDAASKFDVFFYRLIETIANAAAKPEILPDSQFAPRK